jgi:hypothetical protein
LKRSASILICALAVTYGGWRIWASQTGYCILTNSFNSPDEILALGIQNEFQYMTSFEVNLNGKTADEVFAKGPPVLWRNAGPAYLSIEEFLAHNKDCCILDPQDDAGRVKKGLFGYILGWTHGLTVSWRMPYFDQNGKKYYRGEFTSTPPGLLGLLENSMSKYGFSTLLVSNCGYTKEALRGDWWGRD